MTAVLDGPLRTAPAPSAPAPAAPAPAPAGPAPSAPPPGAPRLRPARIRPAARASPSVPEWPAVPDPPVPRLPDHPDARAAVVRVLRLACEVLDGRRPYAHLAAHAEPVVLRYWRAAAAPRRSGSPTRIGRPHVQHPCEGAAEVATALHVAGRPRALAARFDLVDGRWRWTAVRLG